MSFNVVDQIFNFMSFNVVDQIFNMCSGQNPSYRLAPGFGVGIRDIGSKIVLWAVVEISFS